MGELVGLELPIRGLELLDGAGLSLDPLGIDLLRARYDVRDPAPSAASEPAPAPAPLETVELPPIRIEPAQPAEPGPERIAPLASPAADPEPELANAAPSPAWTLWLLALLIFAVAFAASHMLRTARARREERAWQRAMRVRKMTMQPVLRRAPSDPRGSGAGGQAPSRSSRAGGG